MRAASGIGRRRSAAREDATKSYQHRRDEIATAAVRVFNRLGYQGASVSALAVALGINRASLYYYISSKKELFDEIVREVVERNTAMLTAIAGNAATPRQKLREAISALMRAYGDRYPLLLIYIREDLTQVGNKRSSWSKHLRKLNRRAVEA